MKEQLEAMATVWETKADLLEEDALSAGFKEHAIKWEAKMSVYRECAAQMRAIAACQEGRAA